MYLCGAGYVIYDLLLMMMLIMLLSMLSLSTISVVAGVKYSGTSDKGHSDYRITSLQRTPSMDPKLSFPIVQKILCVWKDYRISTRKPR